MEQLTLLYQSLDQRKRPEDIAQLVLELLSGNLSRTEEKLLKKASKGSMWNRLFGYTSMLQEFAAAVGAQTQVNTAIQLFGLHNYRTLDGNSVPDVQGFIQEVSPIIHKAVGKNNFLTDRLSKAERDMVGLDISKRSYNKKWRLLKRLERKLLKYERELRKVEFQKISKHGIVHRLDLDNFSADLNTACFIAYFTATSNKRSMFTNCPQDRAYDEVSDMLMDRCIRQRTTNWWAIAHVYTGGKVLAKLSDEQRGQLLGTWTSILQDIAHLLGDIWQESQFNRKTMIVQRGNDSTTWNNTAGAWNKARDNWINLLYAMGMEYVLDDLCFGKVMRLMAADVAVWHRLSGGKLDPNTEVWNVLPLPWEVFQGKATCNKYMVISACVKAGINTEKSGWIAPRKHKVAVFKPTPELVHGVAMSNPFLALYLKQHRFFSGKAWKKV